MRVSVLNEPRRLIVNGDDFGASDSINEAIIRAHRGGILTTASLMVGGDAAESAILLARQNPGLGVGLHLTLVCGRSVLRPEVVPGLVDGGGRFGDRPVRLGFRYFWQHSLRGELEREIEAQFRKFHSTGLALDHVNGHLHFHLHPVVMRILLRNAKTWGIQGLRLARDPLGLNLRLAKGRWAYRFSHALLFSILAGFAQGQLSALGIRHTDRVFGLLQNGRVDERFVARLIELLPPGDSELYSHPSLDAFRHEWDALISDTIRSRVNALGIRLIRYQDL